MINKTAENKAQFIAKAVRDNWTSINQLATLSAPHPQLDGQSTLAALIDGKVDEITAIF